MSWEMNLDAESASHRNGQGKTGVIGAETIDPRVPESSPEPAESDAQSLVSPSLFL
jgi:hypothetical protein